MDSMRDAASGASGGRQKQVDVAVERAFAGKKSKSKKVKKCEGQIEGSTFSFFHWGHKVLVYDLAKEQVVSQWWEKPTDKRIMRAALAALRDRVGRSGGGAKSAVSKDKAAGENDDNFPANALVERWPCSLRVKGKAHAVTMARGGTISDRGSTFVAVAAFGAQRGACDVASVPHPFQKPTCTECTG